MATAREHFALDWIKADLLETLNDARIALDEYAELGKEETRMRACLTCLHQVHGTLVMLELKGVSQLADHLEQLAQSMLAKQVTDEPAAGQALMQGILELPGYLDEIQRGAEDNLSTSMPLVNEIRSLLSLEALLDPAGASLREGASDEAIARFHAIGGPEKVTRIRSAYQNVLLSILKGEDRSSAVGTLSKIALGLEKVTESAPMARQWQAFAEFVDSLKQHSGALESEAVKLLRRVDLELKVLAKDGESALRRPINMELVQQLLDGAVERDYRSDTVVGLQEAVARDVSNNTLAISGRQALGSAANALQEDLSQIKDKLDLLVRAGQVDLEELRKLVSPLQQVGSTLSLLGFESSREIISDQVDAIEKLVVLGDSDPQGVQSIAGALIQIDENLSSVILGSGQTEVEQITSDAQLQVLREARKDLDLIKQCIVDFVTAHWSIGHLEAVPGKLAEIRGALGIIPLNRAIEMLGSVGEYVENRLLKGHRPEWQELDQFADVISAVDYYLERLADETSSGADEILVVAQRGLVELLEQPQTVEPEIDQVAASSLEQDAAEIIPDSAEPLETAELSVVNPELELEAEPESEAEVQDAVESEEVALEVAAVTGEVLDPENIPAMEEPKLELEQDAGFDLSNNVFASLEGAVEQTNVFGESESEDIADSMTQALGEDVQEHNDEPEALESPVSFGSEGEESSDDNPYDAIEYEPALPAEVEEEAEADIELSEDLSDSLVEESSSVAEAPLESAAAAPIENMPDAEIVEIFVEEVDEVLENIAEYAPIWGQDFANADALAEIRRAFHTLKGSGRIVQAAAIGEMAWGVENMLNRVIENTVTPNPQFVAVINAGCALTPRLRDSFAAGQQGDLDAVSLIIEQADVLASGGEIDVTVFETPNLQDSEAAVSSDQATEAQVIEPEVAEAQVVNAQEPQVADVDALDDMGIEFVADDVAEPVEFDLQSFEEAETAEREVFTPAKEESDAFEDELTVASADVGEEDQSTLNLFLSEALEHLANLQEENAKIPWAITDPIARAFHTLTGTAGMAEIDQVRLIVEPAYQVVESFRTAPATEELHNFFLTAERHLAECIDALKSGAEWEEPLEFVAAADDLLAIQGASPRAVDLLLDAPVTAALFEHEDAFKAYLAEADRGGEQVPVPGLAQMLQELAVLAADMRAEPLADLSLALQKVLGEAADLSRLPSGAATVMRASYNQIIDQLNEIAAGSEVVSQQELIAALGALDLSTAAPVAVEVVDEVIEQIAESVEDLPEVDATASDTQAELAELAEVDPDLIQVFFEEAEEICEELEASIMNWSTERDNRIYMENMLRGLHTLKGGARLCGLAKLGDMAHDFESVVIEVQSNERSIDDTLFTALNARFDEIANRLNLISSAVNEGEAPVESQADALESVSSEEPEMVEVAVEPGPEATADNVVELPAADVLPVQEDSSTPDTAPASAPAVSDVNKIIEAVSAPAASATPAKQDKAARAKADAPSAGNHEMVRVGSALLEELVNLAGESSILRARIEQGMSDFTGALDEMEITIERLREQLRRLEIETETQILHRHERTDGPQYENFDPLEMDRYNHLQQLSRGLSESASDMLDLKDTLLFKARESETLLLQQARINTELQEGLMRTRMVPFSRLMPRLRRIVRQVSTELGKDVEFHVQNAEGELDRNLLERMVPPLEHMLRNAVDHGIESEELRRNYGKPAGGRIDLRLTREGGDVVIEIIDDGAGIDVESVRAKAIERGLMAEDAQLADEEVLQFVLAAGFSTAKSVTQISGRGVGLDVVASEVKQLGGSVSILSAPGKGTRFVVRVPFTVSVNRALMVSVAEDLYAIPLNTIEGIVLLSPEQLQGLYNSDSKTFEYAGIPYRLRYLGQYLGREYNGAASGQASVPMVLVRSGDHAVAIHVDLVQGSREIVVKSLGPQFAGVGGISGATILGDGSVVVILDLLALIRAQQFERQRSNPNQARRSGPRCVMVVDDSVTVRKVTSRLLERQGMDVLVAKDGVEAVAMLQERRPDIMLLDIEMPRMDGFEVARQVRHDDRLSDLPIVMISSRTGDKHKEHANQLGVNKFLGKPFQENELLATIDELVSRN